MGKTDLDKMKELLTKAGVKFIESVLPSHFKDHEKHIMLSLPGCYAYCSMYFSTDEEILEVEIAN